jgi:hypothetical protein
MININEEDHLNYNSNGRLRISNSGTPQDMPNDFYATAGGTNYQKENPNTLNVSKGSMSS